MLDGVDHHVVDCSSSSAAAAAASLTSTLFRTRRRQRQRTTRTSNTTLHTATRSSASIFALVSWFLLLLSLSATPTTSSGGAVVSAFGVSSSSSSSSSSRQTRYRRQQQQQQQQHRKHHRTWGGGRTRCGSSTTDTTDSGVTQHHGTSLQQLTVKELRERVKESCTERGIVSKLKRKQDLIDYLQSISASSSSQQQQQINDDDDDHDHDTLNNSTKDHTEEATLVQRTEGGASQTSSNSKPRVIVQMPKLSDDTDDNNKNDDNHVKGPSNDKKKKPPSPKEASFERVYRRYPILRQVDVSSSDSVTKNLNDDDNHKDDPDDDNNRSTTINNDNNNNIIINNDDIRQWQHPIYHNNNVTTDMDVVFVGTASCTPGVTRGVSCTALRLHWRRQTVQWKASGSSNKDGEGGGRLNVEASTAATTTTTNRKAATGGYTGGTWIFDVGECTQLQVQRTTSVRPSKITKIFLTHAHGDHSFGLPGLLCLMGQDYDRGADVEGRPVVDIYGPEGLRMWLRVAIRYSVSRIVPPYRIHELMDLPMAPEWEFSPRARRFFHKQRQQNQRQHQQQTQTHEWGAQGLAGQDPSNWISVANSMPLEPSSLYGEVEGGRSIYPQYNHPLSSDGAPVYEVEDENDVRVYAAPMSHGIPCVGYVVDEQPRPGRFRQELVQPIVQRNLQALREAGFKVPMKAMAVIKNLPEGSSFTFPDGTVVTQEEAVEPQRQGRKVVICGDTCDCRALTKLAHGADLIIHEATNAYLEGLDANSNAAQVERDAIIHGHSTPTMAARFARATQAQRLVLNHFSARYRGDTSVESLSIMQRIEEQAIRNGVPGWNETHVAAAWDLMVLPVPQK